MLDTTVRPLLNPLLNALGAALARAGVSANAVTGVGVVVAIGAVVAVACQWYAVAFGLVVLNRLLDGVDGAVARVTQMTDWGGYADIVADYVFYAGVPLGFAIADPAHNALPAAALLAGFCLTASSFLAFAAIAAKRGIETNKHGRKAFFYSTGVVEGTETVVCLLLMTALPQWFGALAWGFAGLCLMTVVQRLVAAHALFVPRV